MVFLLTSTPLLAAALVLAVALGAAYFIAHARRRAREAAEREAHALRQRDTELTHIRRRLEEIYERQQTGAQTQFARVNQELEDLQSSLDAKGRQIDGVQGQLRYELKRHEEEIAALRNQLREAIEVFAAAALPASRPAAPALSEPAALPASRPASPAATDEASAPPADDVLKEDTELLDDMFGRSQLDDEAGGDDAPEAAEPDRPFTARSVLDEARHIETNDDFEFVDIAPPARAVSPPARAVSWTPFDEAAGGAPSSPEPNEQEPPGGDLPHSSDLPHSGDGIGSADAFAGDAYARPAFSAFTLDSEADARSDEGTGPLGDAFGARPERGRAQAGEHEDLTALSVVDEPTQARLYALGVTTVEAIARWSRADARRIAAHLAGTSEDDIMDRWVFEAQAVLFDRYQAELRQQRRQRVAG